MPGVMVKHQRARGLALLRSGAIAAAALLMILSSLAPIASSAASPESEIGYIAVGEGRGDPALLWYKADFPDPDIWGPGPYPVLVYYSAYFQPTPGYEGRRFQEAGYVVVGIDVRGMGCSSGVYHAFSDAEGSDGAEAIDWLATRPWANRRVGMVGYSYPGITQLIVAAKRPQHLVAIAPGHVFADFYRDIVYPGGIYNDTFPPVWGVQRVQREQNIPGMIQYAVDADDDQCIENQQSHVLDPAFNPAVQLTLPQNSFDGPYYRERSPAFFADRINVPVFLVESWQDQQLGSRGVEFVERLKEDNPSLEWKLSVSNGDHYEWRRSPNFDDVLRFLSFYVRQEIPPGDPYAGMSYSDALNLFEAEPPVTVRWEVRSADKNDPSNDVAWTDRFPTWPAPEMTPWPLYLTPDGGLAERAPNSKPTTELPEANSLTDPVNAVEAGSVQYAYSPIVGTRGRGTWRDLEPPPGTFASFTTEPLEQDRVLLGPASVDMWISSTQPDTDLQITLTELRPDGQEVYVQQGWLRASHRAEDPTRSNVMRPFHTHRLADLEPLVPGRPTRLRVELFPFGQVFRAGSRLRISIEAPHWYPDDWGFAALPTPATNTIFASDRYPSSVVLPLLPGATAQAPLPPCSLSRQPCKRVSE